METVVQNLGRRWGLRHVVDNYVVPIKRWQRFYRLAGPGYFRINPLNEQTMTPIYTGTRLRELVLEDVLSGDHIPFHIKLTIFYRFVPQLPGPQALVEVVNAPADRWDRLLLEFASSDLRRLIAAHNAELLNRPTIVAALAQDLALRLRAQLRPWGFLVQRDGVLLGEMLPPSKFINAILNAYQQQTMLNALASYREIRLLEQVNKALLVSQLDGYRGHVSLISGLDGSQLPLVLGDGLTINGDTDGQDSLSERATAVWPTPAPH